MSAVMAAKRPRFVIDTTDDMRRAVALRALRLGKKPNDVVADVLEREFAPELKEAKKFKREEGGDE